MARRSVEMEIRAWTGVDTPISYFETRHALGTPYIRGEVACISYAISR